MINAREAAVTLRGISRTQARPPVPCRMVGDDTVRFYDGEGNLIHTVSLETEPIKKAA